MKAEIKELGNRKTMEKISKTKSWFFEKVHKIHKLQLDEEKKDPK